MTGLSQDEQHAVIDAINADPTLDPASDHFDRARRCLDDADDSIAIGEYTEATHYYRAAQVHATLAQAAATRDLVELTRRIHGANVATAEQAEPAPATCAESCCWPGDPDEHRCTQYPGHPGRHVSVHTNWGGELR